MNELIIRLIQTRENNMSKMTVKDTIRMLNQAGYELQQLDEDLEVESHVSYPHDSFGGDYVKPIHQIDIEYEEGDGDTKCISLGIHY